MHNGISQKMIREVVLGVVEACMKVPDVRFANPKDIKRRAADLAAYKKAMGL